MRHAPHYIHSGAYGGVLGVVLQGSGITITYMGGVHYYYVHIQQGGTYVYVCMYACMYI